MPEWAKSPLKPFAISLILSLAACQRTIEAPPQPPVEVAEPPAGEGWHNAAREEGIVKVGALAAAWEEGLAAAREGFAAQIDAAGPLLRPGAGQPRAALPPGSYHCRVIRLGAGNGRRAYTIYPAYFCHVGLEEDGLLAFTKQTGSERFGGYLYEDGDTRLIFLGATSASENEVAPAYGADAERDLVGVAERVGPMRYRIAFPRPRNGAILDVLELVPYSPPLE